MTTPWTANRIHGIDAFRDVMSPDMELVKTAAPDDLADLDLIWRGCKGHD